MTFRFGAVSTLSITAIVLMACGGKTVSIGSETQSETIVPSAVTVATSECSQGFEHANICCTGGSDSSDPTCKSYVDDPFHPCDSGWTTYPNAATCCSLDDPSNCTGSCGNGSTGNTGECQIPASQAPTVSVLADGGFAEDAGVDTTCESRCPPGYSGISPYDAKGCCRSDSGGETCFGEASVSPTTSVPEDAGVSPILLPDGGVYDAGTTTVDAGCYPNCQPDAGVSTPPSDEISACAFECPDGWFVADAVEGLCCNNGASGTEECFAAVFPDDNGGGESTPPSTGVSPTPVTDASATINP